MSEADLNWRLSAPGKRAPEKKRRAQARPVQCLAQAGLGWARSGWGRGGEVHRPWRHSICHCQPAHCTSMDVLLGRLQSLEADSRGSALGACPARTVGAKAPNNRIPPPLCSGHQELSPIHQGRLAWAGVTFWRRFHAETDLNAAQSGDEATMGQAKRETNQKRTGAQLKPPCGRWE